MTSRSPRFTSRPGPRDDLDDKAIRKWQALARDTAWKDYGEKSANCARLLKLAEKTI